MKPPQNSDGQNPRKSVCWHTFYVCGRYYSLFDEQQAAEHFHVRRIADNVGIIAELQRRAR